MTATASMPQIIPTAEPPARHIKRKTYEALGRALEALEERGHEVLAVTHLPGDISRRHYVRVHLAHPERDWAATGAGGGATILALYPKKKIRPVCHRYVATGELLTSVGVRVARVYESDCESGWMLLEDLGSRNLFEYAEHPWGLLEPWFGAAVDTLQRIAQLDGERVAHLSPALDRELLETELEKTYDEFLEPVGSSVDAELRAALSAVCARLGDEPPVVCHRDFGARNLLPLREKPNHVDPSHAEIDYDGPERVIGVLDHQDLRLGPSAYDLASLLNDSLLPPPEVEERLLARAGYDTGEARQRYHRSAVQRTLKAIGSYAAFAHKGHRRHVPLIAPTLERTLRHVRQVPEIAPLAERLADQWGDIVRGERTLP
jgi:aminoglycoside/choline kinase family phosphotransferase